MSALLPLVWPQSSLPLKAVRNTTLNTRPSTGEPEIDYLKLILNARVYDVANETPLTYASKLSTRLGNKIYLKREDLQPIFSFKCRGAYNKMYQLTPSERSRGVCAASAGNHAQGSCFGC
ncbi:hypothetical protein BASA62_007059 [Batrachochytrium salamandrivorans]|nr:hypothetical protein BASA62_007059 [Batrachochytrium salamandrivorans]